MRARPFPSADAHLPPQTHRPRHANWRYDVEPRRVTFTCEPGTPRIAAAKMFIVCAALLRVPLPTWMLDRVALLRNDFGWPM
jgi:hypothetical protein